MSNPPSSDGLNNRFNSYQQSGSYVPPGGTLADQQTNTLSDTVKTQYEAESTANAVLNELHGQRRQFQGANDDVWDMRKATEQTRRELESLRAKYLEKKMRLYGIIAMLSTVNLFLFYRIVSCRGGFFC
jgi:chromosome segregation ATPase